MTAVVERPSVAVEDGTGDWGGPRRRCPNPACVCGNVRLPVSGRNAICAACDGAGEFGSAREMRERFIRGRNTALTLALQSIGAVDDADTEGDIWV